MMLNSKSIGNKIAEARKKINLTQAELAQHVSISPQAAGKNTNLKRLVFIDCQADRLTMEFLKHGKADVSGITFVL